MKYLYFILILVSLPCIAPAQKKYFSDTTNAWHRVMSYWTGGSRYETYYARATYSGDSVINGRTYSKMGNACVRDDTAANKVYIVYDTSELVLYDYNLSVGDTFYAALRWQTSPQVWHIVDSIDSVQINGIFHKRFYLNLYDVILISEQHSKNYVVTEGIGANLDPLFSYSARIGNSTKDLYVQCFRNNGSIPAMYGNCKDTILSVSPLSATSKAPEAYPQPAGTYVKIQLHNKIQKGDITVYNPLGQLVYTAPVSNSAQLKITNPGTWHGVYYYRITDNNGNSYSGKLLFE